MKISIDMQDGSPVRQFNIQERFSVLCQKAKAIVALKCNVPVGSLSVVPYVSGTDPTSLSFIEVLIQRDYLNEYALGGSFTRLCVSTVYGENDNEYMGNISPSGITLCPVDWANIIHNSTPSSTMASRDIKVLNELHGNLNTTIRGMAAISNSYPDVGELSERLGVTFSDIQDRFMELKSVLQHEIAHKEVMKQFE